MQLSKVRTIILFLAFPFYAGFSQITNNELLGQLNAMSPEVPFLLISPTANSGGLAGIQSVPGHSSYSGVFGNPGLLSHDSSKKGLVAAFTPWVRELIPDINLYGVGGYYRISRKHTIGINAVFLDRGEVTFIQAGGQQVKQPRVFEFAPSISYAYNSENNLSMGIRAKFIQSDITSNFAGGIQSWTGRTAAIDFGLSKKFDIEDSRMAHQVGLLIQNFGSKLSYSKDSPKHFIPINLKLGYRLDYELSSNSSLFMVYEAEKLLIPTPPIYKSDSHAYQIDPEILYGYDPDVSVPLGVIRSFYDAPDGFKEELHEIIHHFGVGLKLKQIHLSAGYFHEHPTKGNKKYFTLGAGYQYHNLHLAASYFIPLYQNHPFQNTIQLSIGWAM